MWEWCADKFEETAYRDRDGKLDPLVTAVEVDEIVLRVVRGGSWVSSSGGLRAAVRDGGRAGYRGWDLGFRVLFRSGPEP